MKKVNALFLYPDYYDATTATRRILVSSKQLFDKLTFIYWARTGKVREPQEKLFEGISFIAYSNSAPPRSLQVLILFIKYQFWLLKNIIKIKPNFISAFTFYTILPALIYRFFINWRCKVVYDPRDYIAVCFRVNKLLVLLLRIIDNLFIKLSSFVIFPDYQYFKYYGFLSLKRSKYYVLPNSTEDAYHRVQEEDIYSKYDIRRDSLIVPLIGYFSETRGKKLFYEIIEENLPGVHFIIAGDFRDNSDITFFSGKQNVSFLGKIPYLEALYIMKHSIFTPLLYDPVSLNNRYAYPTKFYDSLMVGTPLLVSYGQADVWQTINQLDIGYAIEYNNTADFRSLLLKLTEQDKFVDKERIREVFLTRYDFNIFQEGLRESYKKIINNS